MRAEVNDANAVECEKRQRLNDSTAQKRRKRWLLQVLKDPPVKLRGSKSVELIVSCSAAPSMITFNISNQSS
jgi:hypothetical protein